MTNVVLLSQHQRAFEIYAPLKLGVLDAGFQLRAICCSIR